MELFIDQHQLIQSISLSSRYINNLYYYLIIAIIIFYESVTKTSFFLLRSEFVVIASE